MEIRRETDSKVVDTRIGGLRCRSHGHDFSGGSLLVKDTDVEEKEKGEIRGVRRREMEAKQRRSRVASNS